MNVSFLRTRVQYQCTSYFVIIFLFFFLSLNAFSAFQQIFTLREFIIFRYYGHCHNHYSILFILNICLLCHCEFFVKKNQVVRLWNCLQFKRVRNFEFNFKYLFQCQNLEYIADFWLKFCRYRRVPLRTTFHETPIY